MSEGIDVYVDDVVAALQYVKTQYHLREKPINDIINYVEDPNISHVPLSYVVRKLVEAGCNIECIRDFMLRSSVIQSDDDWVQMKQHVERAVLLSEIQLKKGIEL